MTIIVLYGLVAEHLFLLPRSYVFDLFEREVVNSQVVYMAVGSTGRQSALNLSPLRMLFCGLDRAPLGGDGTLLMAAHVAVSSGDRDRMREWMSLPHAFGTRSLHLWYLRFT